MGNAICCRGGFRRHDIAAVLSEPLDEGLGHSFCYVRPDISLSKVHSEDTTTTFRTISGASVSANASTPLSTSFVDFYSYSSFDRAAAFESSTSFASIPLQPVPRFDGLNERGFMSGPIERGFVSGPLYSGNLEKFSGGDENLKLKRSFSHGFGLEKKGLIRGIGKAIARRVSRGQKSIVAPVKGVFLNKDNNKEFDWMNGLEMNGGCLSSEGSLGLGEDECLDGQSLQWAQGKAGEDRVHVVISEENGLVFIGIYDGFNGPDAPDFLLSNLYPAVQKELKGLLWDDTPAPAALDENEVVEIEITQPESRNETAEAASAASAAAGCCSNYDESESYPNDLNLNSETENCRAKKCKSKARGAARKWEESQRRWKCEWDRERLELDQKLKEQLNTAPKPAASVNHGDVMKALSEALRKTEEAYLDITDMMAMENPELALMGSCILVMLMKGEDVYLMNVGDSRAVLAQKAEPDFLIGHVRHDLERINEDGDEVDGSHKLASLQLTKDHCTSIVGEVQRIKNEHQDDACAVVNDRVKGSLKVTRAFGAGFLKQPKWNNALLEMFHIDYVGTCPYISCTPSLYHHKLSSKDKFLILSSDGLYEYFTNQEAVAEVELFIASSPEGDPAQHLIEEVLFRAAKKAGMDFHELLDIPQGDCRRYHDDVSVIVISLEGGIRPPCVCEILSSGSVTHTPLREAGKLEISLSKRFSFKELRYATGNFHHKNSLGWGVFKGWIDENKLVATKPGKGIPVAIKRCIQQSFQEHDEWQAEVEYLGKLYHPNRVRLFGYCLDDKEHLLVYEFIPRGRLDYILSRSNSPPLSWSVRMKIALGAAKGLAFLHSAAKNVIHPSVKSSNILLDSVRSFFGVSGSRSPDILVFRPVPTDMSYVSTEVAGDHRFITPEYVSTGHLTPESDVYRFGALFMEIALGERVGLLGEYFNLLGEYCNVLGDFSKSEIFLLLKGQLKSRLAVQCSLVNARKAADLACQCLSEEAQFRPSMDEVVTILEQLQVC